MRAAQYHETVQEGGPNETGTTLHGTAPLGLTKVEIVLVKDTWNKFLAFDSMLIETFFERLLIDAPDLLEQLGPAVDQAPAEFLRLIDLAVRRLFPSTEETLRESYREAPGAREARASSLEESGAFFAAYGVTAAQWEVARQTFIWTLGKIPYLEEYERENLALGADSAHSRFFVERVVEPMMAAARAEDEALSPAAIDEMRRGAEIMLAQPRDAGTFFYQTLFRRHPEVLRHFRTADMDALSKHLIETVVFLVRAAGKPETLRSELRHLAAVHLAVQIPSADYAKLAGPLLETLAAHGETLSERARRGWVVLFARVVRIISEPMAQQERLAREARSFIAQVGDELDWPAEKFEKRWSEIRHEIRATGTYTHSFEELEFGARLAWRNAPKCIGRIAWKNLVVRDRRHVTDPAAIYAECLEHLRAATNGGQIEIVMTVFRATKPQERWGPRIWNQQLIRYAGYAQPNGSVIGDRANVELTEAIEKLGWTPPAERGEHDLLPLVIDVPGEAPRLFPLDRSEVLEVGITHPTEPGIGALGMKWCAVPAIANFRMEIGGIDYGCLPFNGWFMGTEIARNLFEEPRYAKAEAIAGALGLDTSSEATLWRDRAFLELNAAIIHSFAEARVTLVDHQTASRQFMMHDLREKRAGRECPAQWSWIAPAAGGSTTPVWHHEMRDFHLTPAYVPAADRWRVIDRAIAPARTGPAAQPRTRRPLILYASETGTAEAYARQASRRLAGLGPRLVATDEVDGPSLAEETNLLVIASTCRDGEVPGNGRDLLAWLERSGADALTGVQYAVLGIGNRIYPKFCAAAEAFDVAFAAAGAERLATLERADEIAGQSDTVKQWLEMLAKLWNADQRIEPRPRPVVEIVPAGKREPGDDGCGTVVFNGEMLGESAGPDRSTRHIAIALDDHDAPFRAGDHLAVHPLNPAPLVDGLCARLGLPTDGWIRLGDGGDSRIGAHPDGYPLRRLLARDVDLAMPEAPEEILRFLAAGSQDLDDRATLERWLKTLDREETDPARQQLRSWLRDTYHSVVDVLDSFPTARVGLEGLLELLPRLRPRLYSIASSPKAHPREVRLMVSVLNLPVPDGRVRRGICSHYLKSLAPGDRVRLAIKQAPKSLPDGFSGPLLLVGAGTGLSALYGMLEERAARGVRSGPGSATALYFGCRSEAELLARADLLGWRNSGVLGRLSVAFSRQGPEKAYVQDAVDADGGAVFRLLGEPDARIVICGDATMAEDVAERLLHVLRREGGLGYADAVGMIETMRREGRYLEDVWGVQLNRDLALPEMVRSRYDRGSGWLARLQRVLAGRDGAPVSIVRY